MREGANFLPLNYCFLRFIGWLVSLVKGKNLVEAELISKFTVNASARYLHLAMTTFSVQCLGYTNSSICRYYLGIMNTESVEDDENWKKWQTKRAKSARRHEKDHQSKMSQGLSFDSGTWILGKGFQELSPYQRLE